MENFSEGRYRNGASASFKAKTAFQVNCFLRKSPVINLFVARPMCITSITCTNLELVPMSFTPHLEQI